METPLTKATRLLAALSDLVDQEDMYLHGGYYDLAVEIRQRSAPLVQQLVEVAGETGVARLGPQVTALVQRSDRHAAFLQEKLQEMGQEIRRTDRARQRTASIAPVYKQAGTEVANRFRAAG